MDDIEIGKFLGHGQEQAVYKGVMNTMRTLDYLPPCKVGVIIAMPVPWRDFRSLNQHTRVLRKGDTKVWVTLRRGTGGWKTLQQALEEEGQPDLINIYYRLTIASIHRIPCCDFRGMDDDIVRKSLDRGDRGHRCCWA